MDVNYAFSLLMIADLKSGKKIRASLSSAIRLNPSNAENWLSLATYFRKKVADSVSLLRSSRNYDLNVLNDIIITEKILNNMMTFVSYDDVSSIITKYRGLLFQADISIVRACFVDTHFGKQHLQFAIAVAEEILKNERSGNSMLSANALLIAARALYVSNELENSLSFYHQSLAVYSNPDVWEVKLFFHVMYHFI